MKNGQFRFAMLTTVNSSFDAIKKRKLLAANDIQNDENNFFLSIQILGTHCTTIEVECASGLYSNNYGSLNNGVFMSFNATMIHK